MPKISIRYLLLGIGLLALGCGLLYVGDHIPPYTDVDMPSPGMLICAFCGMSFIGAGIFAPFKHPFIGALVGFLFPVGLIIGTMILGHPI